MTDRSETPTGVDWPGCDARKYACIRHMMGYYVNDLNTGSDPKSY